MVVVVVDLLLFCSVIVPLFDSATRVWYAVPFALSFLAMAVTGILTMATDPIDENSERDLASKGQLEDGYDTSFCRYCQAYVHWESIHCWSCQKCVARFDHHCPWLNTCIGVKNYGSFYVAIVCLFVVLSIMFAAATHLLVLHVSGDISGSFMWFEGVVEEIELIALIVILVVNVPFLCLNATLVAFHTYLCVSDITTYDFLTGKVSKRREAREGGSSSRLNQEDAETLQESSEDEPDNSTPFRHLIAEDEDSSEVARTVSDYVFGDRGTPNDYDPPVAGYVDDGYQGRH